MEVDIHSIADLPDFVLRLWVVTGVVVVLGRNKDDGKAASSSAGFLSLAEAV